MKSCKSCKELNREYIIGAITLTIIIVMQIIIIYLSYKLGKQSSVIEYHKMVLDYIMSGGGV